MNTLIIFQQNVYSFTYFPPPESLFLLIPLNPLPQFHSWSKQTSSKCSTQWPKLHSLHPISKLSIPILWPSIHTSLPTLPEQFPRIIIHIPIKCFLNRYFSLPTLPEQFPMTTIHIPLVFLKQKTFPSSFQLRFLVG